MALTRSHASNILDSDFKSSCRVTTTTNITLSGSAPSTYDGVTLVANDRILVQGQTDGSQNGIYYVATLGTGSNGTWTRASDATLATSLSPGVTIYVEEGTTNGNRFYVISNTGTVTIGTTAITFTSFNGPRGGNAMVQFNDQTNLGGATYWSYNKTSGNLYSNSTTASASTTTGALVVGGGVGIGGALYVGSNSTFTGNLLPSSNVTYNLGSTTQRWNNLWLAGSTIWLGSIALKDNNGSLSIYDSTGTNQVNLTTASINSTPIGNATPSTGAFTTLTTTSDITVGGNLIISGTTTTVNSTTVSVNDINIVLANNAASSAAADGAGITVNGAAATILYTHATTSWNLNKAVIAPSLTTTSGGQVTGYHTGAIGANTANTGVFTTVTTTSGGQLTGYHTGAIGANTANTGVFTTVTTTSGGQVTGYLTGAIGANTANSAAFTTLTATGTVNLAGTITAATVNASTIGNSGSTLTGTLSTASQTNITSVGTLGSLAVTGNITAGNLQINGTGTVVAAGHYGNHYWANGVTAVISYTAASTAPTAQRVGDQWYDTSSDILYTRINDGTTNYWLDISSVPNSFSNLVATVANIATMNVTGNLNFTNVAAYVTVAGNITAGNIVSSTGGLYALNYYYPNGIPFTGGAATLANGSQGMIQFSDTSFSFGGATNLKYDKSTGNLVSNVSTASTSKTTGAIVTAGGVGIGGNVFANAIYSDNHFFANGTTITTPAGGSNTQLQYNNSGSFAGASGLTTNGTNLTATGGLQNTPIGNSTASTGAFTTLTATSTANFAGTVTAATVNATSIGNSATAITAATVSAAGGTSLFASTLNSNPASLDAGRIFGIYNANYMPGASYGAADTRIFDFGVTTGNIAFLRTSGTNGLQIYAGGNGTSFNNALLPTVTTSINIGSTTATWNSVYASTFYRGGTRLPTFTTASSAPSSPVIGDFWYKSGSDIVYQYVNDGTSSFWLDLTTKPSIYSNIAVTSNLYVSGTISSTLTPAANVTYNLGSATANWGTVYAVTFSGTSTTAKYADLAENYLSDEPLDPGDVVIFGGKKEIKSSYRYADTRIAGVISTNPAYLMNSDLEDSYPVALTGRVPCKVIGPVHKGDVLTTSNIIGVAQALHRGDFEPGCLLGKSLEDHLENTIKTIEIVVGRY